MEESPPFSAPKSDEPSLLDPVLAVYYHTEWRARRLMPPEALLPVLRLPNVREAVSQLALSIADPARAHDANAAMAGRQCVAQLFRRWPEPGTESREWGTPIKELLRALDEVKAINSPEKTFLELFEEARAAGSPDARFFAVYNHASFRPITAYRIRHYSLAWSYAHRVTDVTVRAQVQRPLMDFRYCVDPRRWSTDLPDTWQEAAPLREPPPADREAACPKDELKQTIPYMEPTAFFEQAVWPSRSTRLTDYRNLLRVEVDVAETAQSTPEVEGAGTIGFTYEQLECLTSRLPFAAQLGGIDVDEGFGRCFTKGGGWCSLEARKRARFSLPHGPLNFLYNDIAAVWILLFIEWLVLLGTQLPPPPPPPPSNPNPI
jgi:hypothetical protein